jgi:DtxR family Mn-dependent transcriptional regulator
MKMTQSLEDYLKTAGLLADRGEVRITDIALRLGVSKPSVLVAMKSLEAQGFLKHKRYCDVVLTEKGKETVAEIRGRYELLLFFLMDVLGVSQKTDEQDSCKLEHVVSAETLNKMENHSARFLDSGRKELKSDQNHDTVVIKRKIGRDYHGMSTGNMSALRNRPCKEKRNIQEW